MSVLDQNIPIMKYFEDISKIPHGSFEEEKIAEYLINFAKERNLKYITDELHNVIIYKDGQNGGENSDPIILQGHTDMVNEKNNDSDHDFSKDPLKLNIVDGWLYATGTTLGADDGVAVCYMLAVLDDKTIKHPPLECVFTTQEEVGMFGANILKAEYFKSKRMIGMDSGGEGITSVSSSGGRRVTVKKAVSFIKNINNDPQYKLSITGLLGGHSGGLIHKERGNSNKLAFRMLNYLLINNVDINLTSATGGLKDNAIPRECNVSFTSSTDLNQINNYLSEINNDIKEELQHSDPNFSYELEKITDTDSIIDSSESSDIIKLIYLLPNGFKSRSMVIEGLTTVSLNMGVLNLNENELSINFALRSPMLGAINEMTYQIIELSTLFDASVTSNADYPGWNYEANSPLRKVLAEVTKEVLDKNLEEIAGHGGLETGVFKGLIPEIDIVTLCAESEDIHTPNEHLNLASYQRMYDLLVKLLAKL